MALMIASVVDSCEITDALLAAGTDVALESPNALSALAFAILKGHREVLDRRLAVPELDVHKRSAIGLAPLHLAAMGDQADLVEKLVRDFSANVELLTAASQGSTDAVTQLLELGANAHYADSDGDTAMSVGVASGGLDVVATLLARGVPVDATYTNERAVLILAAAEAHDEIVELLVATGADVNHATSLGETALMVAARQGHTEIVDRLVAAGALVHKVTATGETATTLADTQGHHGIAERLRHARDDTDQVAAALDVSLALEYR